MLQKFEMETVGLADYTDGAALEMMDLVQHALTN
jgi:hypothetical protein